MLHSNFLTETQAWIAFEEQIERAVVHTGNPGKALATMQRLHKVSIVDCRLELDNGTMAHFTGCRVQHNVARGPGKGGIRFHPRLTLGTVAALAGRMSIKTAALNLPFGGAKGGVRVDPTRLSADELKRLSFAYITQLADQVGPQIDIPAPDVSTNAEVMAWMVEAYGVRHGRQVLGVVTGKPLTLGGSHGRREATGRGVFLTTRCACRKLGLALEGARVAIQGFGNVGSVAATMLHDAGATIVSVQDHTGTLVNPNGINPCHLLEHLQGNELTSYPLAESIDDPTEFWGLDVDILVPAALSEVITEQNAPRIRARLIVEGANGPTTATADDILRENGVTIVPDALANAGGVTVSFFEWLQNNAGTPWSLTRVNDALDRRMVGAFDELWEIAQIKRITLRDAVYVAGISRILDAEL